MTIRTHKNDLPDLSNYENTNANRSRHGNYGAKSTP